MNKVDPLLADWDAKLICFQAGQLFQTGKGAADDKTADAIRRQEQLARILVHALAVDNSIDWQALKDRSDTNRDQ